jgi:hypothetical protein
LATVAASPLDASTAEPASLPGTDLAANATPVIVVAVSALALLLVGIAVFGAIRLRRRG